MALALNGVARKAGWAAVVPLLSATVTLLLCNAAFLIPSYLRGSKSVCMIGSLCSDLATSSTTRIFGVPIPVYGALAYVLELVLLYRWLVAPAEKRERAYHLLWAFSGLTVLVSVPLYIYGAKVLGGGCFFCFLNASLSCLSLALVMVAGSEAVRPVKRRLFPRMLAIAPLLAAGFVALGNEQGPQLPRKQDFIGALQFTPTDDQLMPGDRPVIGDPKAPMTIVIFSDPVCPACQVYVPKVVNQVRSKLNGKARIVYRQYPLDFHPQAGPLSRLEIWAQTQGKFEAVAKLIEDKKGDTESVMAALPTIGLDRKKAEAALTSGTAKAGIEKVLVEDQLAARHLLLRGTPYFLFVEKGKPIKYALGGAVMEVLDKGL